MNNEEKTKENDLLEDAIEKKTNNTLIKENKKKKRKVIIISLIIVIFIMVLIAIFYILNNPRLIFKLSIDNTFNILENTLTDVKDVSIKDNNLSNEKIEAFNQLKIDEENSKIVLDSLKKAVIDSTALEKITRNKITIKVNGEDIDTKRVTLVIDGKNVSKIYNNFIKILKGNEEFLSAYSNVTGLSKNEIKQKITSDTSNIYSYIPLTVSIYTSGINHEFVKLEISQDVNNNTNVINITKMNNNEYEYKIVNSYKTISGNIIYQDKVGMNITYNVYETDALITSGTLTVENHY